MITPFINLLNTVLDLYLMVVILRFWLQLVRADFYNPLSQFVVRFTHPVLTPLRRIIPGFGGFDIATLVFAYVVASIKFVIFYFTVPVSIPVVLILYLSLLTLLKQAGVLLFWILIARAVLSWISQGRSTVEYVLAQLTEPLLTPIRRIIPSIGGLDLSFLILFLILQFINTTLGMYVPGWLNA